ncbi:hypothetical protein SSUR61_0604 [Streptococcus suis R61]|uniref:Uncharacterized protein n=1 Tax=Streptococcus suis R61 TaxID=996306 RepID=A0AA87F9A7_STRSU|nr:hypothetical protein SSUR61_0604 [Streptococcus suis R61]
MPKTQGIVPIIIHKLIATHFRDGSGKELDQDKKSSSSHPRTVD